MNEIVQIKAETVEGPAGAANAMMINLDIGSANELDAFLTEVIDQFKVQRTLAPPDTSMMLITIVGDVDAGDFAQRWQAATATDPIVQAYLSLMSVADVMQGDNMGNVISSDSLLPSGHTPMTLKKKPWWKIW